MAIVGNLEPFAVLDDEFASTLVETLSQFVKIVSPPIDEIVDEVNEEDA